jgi:hypothetical protein
MQYMKASSGRQTAQAPYEPPRLVELGTLSAVTLGCDKRFGSSDGYTFMGQSIICASP